jgi:tRNA-guanine family transglycosylase
MPESVHAGTAEFETVASVGDARAGRLTVNGMTLETPHLFPVLNFYAGGRATSVFGGGIHRTLKEFIIGADRVPTGPLTDYFQGVMTSVGSLTDYDINYDLYETYLKTPIKQRSIFSPFNGLLFVDSGGFKFLSEGGLNGSNFKVEMNQETVLETQRKLGGDILVNLDHPITPDDDYTTRIEKAERTAENIQEFISLTADFQGGLYLTLHGYNYSMMEEFLTTVTETVPEGVLREAFDGVALGSLVPKKDNVTALMRAVTDCRDIMADWGMGGWPLHVLGISSRASPLLVGLGVDSFDSSAYLHGGINGKYSVGLMETVSLDNAPFHQCDCPVCSTPELVNWMRGETQYQKDILGPVAMHNLIIQQRELARLRERITEDEVAAVQKYMETTFGADKTMRRYAHEVVNRSLGGYFQ